LSTGVVNGAHFDFLSPSGHRWRLNLQPLDGNVEIVRR